MMIDPIRYFRCKTLVRTVKNVKELKNAADFFGRLEPFLWRPIIADNAPTDKRDVRDC